MKLKRLLAYIIDILIVGFIASAISSIEVINPYYDNYIEAYEKYSKEMDSLNEDNVIFFILEVFKNGIKIKLLVKS